MKRDCSFPQLARPISPRQFMREFEALWAEARAAGHPARPHPTIQFTEALFKTHQANCRRYGECDPVHRIFYWAPQVLTLPIEFRRGLVAHEIGHSWFGPCRHTEKDADEVARKILGVEITYDKRWPKKGLQTGRFVRL